MSDYDTKATRRIPYKNFRFKVLFDGDPVAGINKVSPLQRQTETITWREGGDLTTPHKTPGQTTYAPIILEQGVTHSTKFEEWANAVWAVGGGIAASAGSELGRFRKTIGIEVYDEAGNKALAYTLYKCWVSSYQALPELDASSNGVAIRSITIEHEGFERDTTLAAPTIKVNTVEA